MVPEFCRSFTGHQYIIQIGCSLVKVAQHGVYELLENCWRNLDTKSQSVVFIQSSMSVDTEKFGTFFIHLYLKICEVNFGEDFSTI